MRRIKERGADVGMSGALPLTPFFLSFWPPNVKIISMAVWNTRADLLSYCIILGIFVYARTVVLTYLHTLQFFFGSRTAKD